MFNCDCECHKTCHLCGKPFLSPNDVHINCADMGESRSYPEGKLMWTTDHQTYFDDKDELEPEHC